MSAHVELPNGGIALKVADPLTALHNASCIVGLLARVHLNNDDAIEGGTLEVAEQLILSALEEIERRGIGP